MSMRSSFAMNGGFTLIELLLAMAVFSFMLLIIVSGFTNVVRLHDAALAANGAQDNARTAVDELTRAVRNSAGVISSTADAQGNTQLCLSNSAGPVQSYFVRNVGTPAVMTLLRNDGCTWSTAGAQAITNSTVKVTHFFANATTSGSSLTKEEVHFTVQVASSNGTTTTVGSGAAAVTSCTNGAASRTFCSVVTLNSGAEPR